jgi:Tfp pilus assembly PilM family ATPase
MRVVGMDIHAERVSAVEIDTAFGRFELRDTHQIKVMEGTSAEEAANRLINSLLRKPDRLVISAPSEMCTFRNLQINSRDKKAVRSALEFELEDDLPFDKDNLHYDAVTLSVGPQGSAIHVGAGKKESFKSFLEHLNSYGIDPEVITTDPWAFRTLLQRIGTGKPIMLFGLEKTKTYVYIHHENKPVLYREIQFGIRKIEQKLAEDLSGTQEQIRSWIHDVGFNGIDQKVSESISEIFAALAPEIKQIELAARHSLKESISHIWITGEGAFIPGFSHWLSDITGKSVDLFRPLSLLSNQKLSYSDSSEIDFGKAIALAMTAIPMDKLPPINFRKNEFEKHSADKTSTWETIRKPLPYIAITALVFFATKSIELQYYKGRLNEVDESLKQSVKNYFSISSGSNISDNSVRNYLADMDKLKKTVQSELSRERELSKLFSPNKNSPINFLKSISQNIGKDIVVDMIKFDAGSDLVDSYKENRSFKTELSFLVANPQMMAKLSDVLEKTYHMKKGASEEVNEDGRKIFKISFNGSVESVK